MGKEHQRLPSLEIPSELLQAYIQVFLSRWDCYPLQQSDGSYRCVKRPLYPEMVMAHLRGVLTLGAYVLDQNSYAHWLCLDADDEIPWEQLKKLAVFLAKEGLTPYLETSRRGGHLWLFTAPTPAYQLRAFGKVLMKQHDLKGIELYPKQDRLKTGPGSQVRLPLGIHRLTGKRYPFITLEGQILAATLQAQIQWMASPVLVHSDYMSRFSFEAVPVVRPTSPTSQRGTASKNEPLSERLKKAISVYEFVSHTIELDEQGRGLCPFHDDQVKSFQVDQAHNYWHCYAGCGGGSIIDYQMKWRQTHGQDSSFTTTIKDLANLLL